MVQFVLKGALIRAFEQMCGNLKFSGQYFLQP